MSGVGQPAAIIAARMTPSVFAALNAAPRMGSVYTRQEDTQHEQMAVLSYGIWKSPGDTLHLVVLSQAAIHIFRKTPSSCQY